MLPDQARRGTFRVAGAARRVPVIVTGTVTVRGTSNAELATSFLCHGRACSRGAALSSGEGAVVGACQTITKDIVHTMPFLHIAIKKKHRIQIDHANDDLSVIAIVVTIRYSFEHNPCSFDTQSDTTGRRSFTRDTDFPRLHNAHLPPTPLSQTAPRQSSQIPKHIAH